MWDVIMSSTYDFAEPGFVLVDRVNEMNNNWWCENIRATNPCGEQPLPPYGSCLLGSVNLTCFVRDPFTENARFDWDEFHKVVRVFTRMLDNVVEVNGLPLEQQRNEIMRKRRHGMGFLGLGSTITMLRMKYGSRDAVAFTERVSKELALAGWEAALELADEGGEVRVGGRAAPGQSVPALGPLNLPPRLSVKEERVAPQEVGLGRVRARGGRGVGAASGPCSTSSSPRG
jgi:ribonucleoside-diphosphate reductase alpha chain